GPALVDAHVQPHGDLLHRGPEQPRRLRLDESVQPALRVLRCREGEVLQLALHHEEQRRSESGGVSHARGVRGLLPIPSQPLKPAPEPPSDVLTGPRAQKSNLMQKQEPVLKRTLAATLAAFALAACGGGGGGSGGGPPGGDFIVLQTSPNNNGTLYLNEAI